MRYGFLASFAMVLAALALAAAGVAEPVAYLLLSGQPFAMALTYLVPSALVYWLFPGGSASAAIGLLLAAAFLQCAAVVATAIFWVGRRKPAAPSCKADA